MNSSGILQKHWLHVAYHFLLDAMVVTLTFVNVTGLRFQPDDFLTQLFLYWPGIVTGALCFGCAAYIFGLYSLQGAHHTLAKRSFLLLFCLGIAVVVMAGIFYLNFSARIGRGVMLGSSLITYGLTLLHHIAIWNRLRNYKERVAFVVTSKYDEQEVLHFLEFETPHIDLVGVVVENEYELEADIRNLGCVKRLPEIAQEERLGRVLCTSKAMNRPSLYREFCKLRYGGVTVMPLIGLYEEIHQFVPLELITPEWMMQASGSPHMLYLKKVKRGFDIVSSLFFLVAFSPVFIPAMLWVKLVSRGPIFYRQIRCGRFGREISVIKLRTMKLDAEKDGAVWASASNDPRVIPGGNLLRKYRIDEIPQLINVLAGEMSFVGPRPERPEFVTDLSNEISFYHERLMVQPGITGWAQVNYPYGSSVEDARRKLEFDLYYMKHMSLFLDTFILLDTVRIIVTGGVQRTATTRFSERRVNEDTKTLMKPSSVSSSTHPTPAESS